MIRLQGVIQLTLVLGLQQYIKTAGRVIQLTLVLGLQQYNKTAGRYTTYPSFRFTTI